MESIERLFKNKNKRERKVKAYFLPSKSRTYSAVIASVARKPRMKKNPKHPRPTPIANGTNAQLKAEPEHSTDHWLEIIFLDRNKSNKQTNKLTQHRKQL